MTRASMLPIISQCPAAAQEPSIPRDSSSESGRLGTAMHFVQRRYIEERYVNAAEAEHLARLHAAEFECDEEELVSLVRYWWCGFAKVADWFPNPLPEVYLESEHLGLTGHIDLLSVSPDKKIVRVLDLKTGFSDRSYEAQVRGYCLLALERVPEASEAYGAILWSRIMSIEGWTWSRGQLNSWMSNLKERISESGYNPGPACQYCPRSLNCPARRQMLASIAYATNFGPHFDVAEPSHLIDGHEKLGILAKAIEDMQAAIKSEVAARGGLIEASDGRRLVLAEQQRREIDGAAWTYLEREVGHDRLHKCLDIKKAELEKLIRETAPYRGGKLAVDSLMKELDRLGLIRTTVQTRLERRGPMVKPLEQITEIKEP